MPLSALRGVAAAGGIIRTEHADGFTIEARTGFDARAEAGGTRALRSSWGSAPRSDHDDAPRTRVRAQGRPLYPLPSPSVLGIPTTWSGIAGYDLLSPAARARLALEPLVPRRRDAGDESVASFFRRRFGAATVEHDRRAAARRHSRRRHRDAVDAVAVSAVRRCRGAHGSVLRAFRNAQRPPGGGLFRSLRRRHGGTGRRAASAPARALCFIATSAVDAIGRDGQGWRLSTAGGSAAAAGIVLACPAFVAAGLFAPIDAARRICAREVPYVSTASVALAWPRGAIAHPLNGIRLRRRAHDASGSASPRARGSRRNGAAARRQGRRCCARSSAARTIRAAVDLTDDELVELASQRTDTRARHHGRPGAVARLPLAARRRAAQRRPARARQRDRAAPAVAPRTVRRRQRLPLGRAFLTASPTDEPPRPRRAVRSQSIGYWLWHGCRRRFSLLADSDRVRVHDLVVRTMA